MAFSFSDPTGSFDFQDGDEGLKAFNNLPPNHEKGQGPNDPVEKLASVFEPPQPLVRYVDQEKAVIDAKIKLRHAVFQKLSAQDTHIPDAAIDVVMSICGQDGFEDEEKTTVMTRGGQANVRFEVVWPHRWWPACMGEQPLYQVTMTLSFEGVTLSATKATLGLTSVRVDQNDFDQDPQILVNGQPCELSRTVYIDHADHSGILPAGADVLMVIRDHYAPDVFFNATDRAGILTLQCVPLDPNGQPESELAQQVKRLSNHPSLMGWYVGHQGTAVDELATAIRTLDPTRPVYRHLPQA